MHMNNEIIIALIGIGSSVVSWFLGKRQTSLNADTTEITNLRESLTTYKELVDSLRQQLAVQNQQIVNLTSQVCTLNAELVELRKKAGIKE